MATASPVIILPNYSTAISIIRGRIASGNPSEGASGNSNLSTLPGSFTGDAIVVPQALSDVNQGIQTWYLAQRQSLTQLLQLETDTNNLTLLATAFNTTVSQMLTEISQAIASIGARFGQTPGAAQPATGTALFGVADAPTSNITVGQGVIVQAANGQQFQTTASVTLIAANAAAYFNSILQLYVLPVPVQAITPGSAGNIPAGSGGLTIIVTPVSGFSYVVNTADFLGGQDPQTDASFVTQVLSSWTAKGKVTATGIIQNVMNSLPTVDGVYVAEQGDPLNLRGFGCADAFVQNRIPATVTESFSAFNHPTIPNAIQPSQGPVQSLTSVSSGTAFLQPDTTSIYQGSMIAQDAIRFTMNPTFPVTVVYEINSAPASCQNLYGAPDTNGVTPLNYQAPAQGIPGIETPLLFHQAPELPVDYAVAITVLPGYQAASVISAVQNAISEFLDGQILGATVYVSDMNNVVQGVTGVLRLAGDPTKFSPTGQAGVDNSITALANQAIITGNILITAA